MKKMFIFKFPEPPTPPQLLLPTSEVFPDIMKYSVPWLVQHIVRQTDPDNLIKKKLIFEKFPSVVFGYILLQENLQAE